MNVHLAEMTWQEFDQKRKDSIVILPVGSTEQHGPHLPLSVDAIISAGLAGMVAEKVNGVALPVISYGYKSAPLSGGGPLFPGTLDMRSKTLMHLVGDILEELVRDEVKKVFILNGHYENEPFVIEAADEIHRQHPNLQIIQSSWWDQVSEDVMGQVFDEVPFPGWALEHAAVAETSLTLYFKPDLVRMERLVEDGVKEELGYTIYPTPEGIVPQTGLLATARTSSAEKGKLLAENIVANYVKILQRWF